MAADRARVRADVRVPPADDQHDDTHGRLVGHDLGRRLRADTTLTIELHSTPVVLATTQTDSTGHYSVTVVIPADTPPGAHEIVIRGLAPSGEERASAVAITVEPAAVPVVPVVVAGAVVVVPSFAG